MAPKSGFFPGGTLSSVRSERGVAVVVVLYGLSIFSVLSLTVLRNAELEKTLRTTTDPDLHVVLYAGGAGSPKILGRLNLPTPHRTQGREPDNSVEVNAPGPVGLAMTAEMPEGWAYAVRLSPALRVCCDSGSGACAAVTWDEQIPQGSIKPVGALAQHGEATDRLRFALNPHSVPEDLTLDRAATAAQAFLVKATRVTDDSAPSPASDTTALSCTLQSNNATLATGTLQLTPGVDEQGRATRVSAGTFDLQYSRPK